MRALLYGIGLQFKFDIRSKSMLITCYLVPLVFFFFMSGIFTSIDTTATKTLISSIYDYIYYNNERFNGIAAIAR